MRKKYAIRFILCSFIFLAHSIAQAKLIQILHTNDTHSFLESATHDGSIGGAARLKSLIDYYKDKMSEAGMKTLVMDAGDFSEGNLFYMADKGRKVFDIHNEMGYDVGALGNHDYLMGTHDLDKILGEMDLKFSLIAANITINNDLKNIRAKIKPFKEFEIDGIKIAVLGLTTNEMFYTWRFQGGTITSPFEAAKKYETILKKRKNDFVIALTHIGVSNDIRLAERSRSIDLIVGGHSHTALFKPTYAINKLKQQIPIVQAGMHTEYLGRLIVDLEVGKPLKIVSYELIPVMYEAADFKITSLVEEANNDLNNAYGKDWLDKEVGTSALEAKDKEGSRKWAYFITDAIKEKAQADVAIHTPYMNGENFPIGSVSRRDLFNSIPRVLDLTEKYGWTIYTAKIRGIWLRVLFETLTHFGQPLSFSGITVDYKKQIFIKGKVIDPSKFYTVAFTEGVIRGAAGVSQYTKILIRYPQNTKFLIWNTLEERIVQSGGRINLNKINEEEHLLFMPEKPTADLL